MVALPNSIVIGSRHVGDTNPCFIIAEAGVNHNGSVERAHALIEAAADAGADAVKFQSFVTEELVTRDAPKAAYQLGTTDSRQSQFDMLKALELSVESQLELQRHCADRRVEFLSTPYDTVSVRALATMRVAAYKIASTDATNVPFLRAIAAQGRPVVLSTGMCTIGEVELAVETLRASKLEEIILLQCTAEYPAPVAEVNLRAMATLRTAFACPVGFSDHTPGIGAAPWSVALGACIVEKHFTLDRNLPGPDHPASLEPDELVQLVRSVRDVEAALGDGIKRPMPSEFKNKAFMQKSLVAARDIEAGQRIVEADLTAKRPGTGLVPRFIDTVVGQVAARRIAKNEILSLGAIRFP